ncbi:MAG: hypothetical protein K5837_04250 [Candidatus Saccharibacteria bacterium]|nr:hypothetical protein [Candidatus Saccharibacteria bacterium]
MGNDDIMNAVMRGDRASIVKIFQEIGPSITGKFYDDKIPNYCIYRDDIDKVRIILKTIAVKACVMKIDQETTDTLIACTAGAVNMSMFARDILLAHFIDIDALKSKSFSAVAVGIKKEEFDSNAWNCIVGMDDGTFQDLLGAIARKEIMVRHAAIKACVLRKCADYYINDRAVPQSVFWLLLYANLKLRYHEEPEVEYVDYY